MNRTARAALLEAKAMALSEYVIEWAGKPIGSVRRALSLTAERAGIGEVTPHVLRHTAAALLAEGGRRMEEIASYMGHADSKVTEKVYAKFTPEYLRKAAALLEFDEISEAHERKAR